MSCKAHLVSLNLPPEVRKRHEMTWLISSAMLTFFHPSLVHRAASATGTDCVLETSLLQALDSLNCTRLLGSRKRRRNINESGSSWHGVAVDHDLARRAGLSISLAPELMIVLRLGDPLIDPAALGIGRGSSGFHEHTPVFTSFL